MSHRPVHDASELLPCAHCGSLAEIESGEANYDETIKSQLYYAEAICVNRITCGNRLPIVLTDLEAARAFVRRRWNTRTCLSAEEARAKAEKIADGLFRNGIGEEATRLVLVVDHPANQPYSDIGGWSRAAVVDRITALLQHEETK